MEFKLAPPCCEERGVGVIIVVGGGVGVDCWYGDD